MLPSTACTTRLAGSTSETLYRSHTSQAFIPATGTDSSISAAVSSYSHPNPRKPTATLTRTKEKEAHPRKPTTTSTRTQQEKSAHHRLHRHQYCVFTQLQHIVVRSHDFTIPPSCPETLWFYMIFTPVTSTLHTQPSNPTRSNECTLSHPFLYKLLYCPNDAHIWEKNGTHIALHRLPPIERPSE